MPPLPKRSEDRRRRNAVEVDRAPAARRSPIPSGDRSWHPVARRWYAALRRSGQAAFYEPSDWAHATYIAEGMSRCLSAERMSGQLFSSVDSASVRLLVTEGDRRRLRLELQRADAGDADEDAAVADIAAYRDRLSG